MNQDERAFLELVGIIKRGNKKKRFNKDEGTAQKSKSQSKSRSKITLRLHGHQEFDKIEIQWKVSWRDEVSGFMSGSQTPNGKLVYGSVNYIIGEVMDYLHPAIQEELVYNMNKL